jgi:hypothetical protein
MSWPGFGTGSITMGRMIADLKAIIVNAVWDGVRDGLRHAGRHVAVILTLIVILLIADWLYRMAQL